MTEADGVERMGLFDRSDVLNNSASGAGDGVKRSGF